MEEFESTQNTLRDTLEAHIDAAEAGTLPSVEEIKADTRERDEVGRFAAREKAEKAPVVEGQAEPAQVAEKPALQRPTTWKKDYLPLWDKMQAGQPLTQEEATKFLEYANQRETEYKTGVSTYKAEAESARQLQEAIAPFVPILQQHNINPAQWIQNLGRAHQVLAKGNPQERGYMFAKLAQDYGVDLRQVAGLQPQQGGGVDPQLMQYIQGLAAKVQDVAGWRQAQETQVLQAEIAKLENDVENHPHFDAVRGTMAQLLETGLAHDLKTAYAKAVRMQDDVWQQEQERLLAHAKAETSNVRAISKAKAAAVSPRSATPSGQASSGAKDRRAILAEQLESAFGGRV